MTSHLLYNSILLQLQVEKDEIKGILLGKKPRLA